MRYFDGAHLSKEVASQSWGLSFFIHRSHHHNLRARDSRKWAATMQTEVIEIEARPNEDGRDSDRRDRSGLCCAVSALHLLPSSWNLESFKSILEFLHVMPHSQGGHLQVTHPSHSHLQELTERLQPVSSQPIRLHVST